ncbi:hypothetical protein [Psychromonas ingrahamii]|uniref:hypothetical protein n=1 Tax=Psychromonas ingrahamii TaxID=357794 RepID=UPI0000D7F4C6|nr:hypothetical protein [Psychromonas ingrahamii]
MQVLLDENTLITRMAYVDLSPIRTTMANSIECSEDTSVHQRIHGNTSQQITAALENKPIKSSSSFAGGKALDTSQGIPFSLLDYIE